MYEPRDLASFEADFANGATSGTVAWSRTAIANVETDPTAGRGLVYYTDLATISAAGTHTFTLSYTAAAQCRVGLVGTVCLDYIGLDIGTFTLRLRNAAGAAAWSQAGPTTAGPR